LVEKFFQGLPKIAVDARSNAEVVEKIANRLLCCGFEALAKRWDKCINVGGRYVEK
jgi:hypothetical protein